MHIDRFRAQAAACVAVLCSGIGVVAIGAAPRGPALTLAAPEVLRLVQNTPAALSSYPAVRMAGTITYSIAGHTVDETLSAVSTLDNRLSSETVAVPSAGKQFTLTTIDKKLFLHLPSGNLPGGAHYGGCVLPAGAVGLGTRTTDPIAYLRLMPGATGGVRVVGHDTIAGVSTTHYELTIDLLKGLQRLQQEGRAAPSVSVQDLEHLGITTMPYDVWIDGHKELRQFGYHLSVHGTSVKAKFRLSGARTSPTVTEPPSSDVYYTPDCNTLGQLVAFG